MATNAFARSMASNSLPRREFRAGSLFYCTIPLSSGLINLYIASLNVVFHSAQANNTR
jgi:hypothetical protein